MRGGWRPQFRDGEERRIPCRRRGQACGGGGRSQRRRGVLDDAGWSRCTLDAAVQWVAIWRDARGRGVAADIVGCRGAYMTSMDEFRAPHGGQLVAVRSGG